MKDSFYGIRILSLAAMTALLALPFSVGAAGPMTPQQQCDRGQQLFRTRKYAEAFAFYSAAARRGYPMAQLLVGECYYDGRGVKQNDAEAARNWRKAAERDIVEAKFRMGLCYAKGRGVPTDPIAAARWFKAAALRKHVLATHNLAVCHLVGFGVLKNQPEALRLFREAAEEYEHPKSMIGLGMCFRRGYGAERNSSEANIWLKKAYEATHKGEFDQAAFDKWVGDQEKIWDEAVKCAAYPGMKSEKLGVPKGSAFLSLFELFRPLLGRKLK